VARYLKTLSLAVLLIGSIGLVQSPSPSYTDKTVTYGGQYTDFQAQRFEAGGYYAEACGDKTGVNKDQPLNGADAPVYIPSDLPCGLGTYEWSRDWFTLGGPTQGPFELKVTASKDNPNKGYYIVTRFGLASDQTLKSNIHMEDFFLTNKPWYDDDNSNGFNEFPDRDSGRPIPKGAFYLASEADRGVVGPDRKSDEGVFIADYGDIITGFGDSLASHSSSVYGLADGGFAGNDNHVGDVLELPFDNGYTFPNNNMDNRCSVASGSTKLVWDGSYGKCSPLHEAGKYKPQGEIIIASEMDADLGSGNLAIREKSKFFICRDVPGSDYTGNNIESSKLVKVQKSPSGSEWKYYRCSEDNDWVEIDCPPGKIFEPTPQPGCVDKDQVFVEATFFDLQGVPNVSTGDNIVAGFMIDQGQIGKYETTIGKELKNIDAECWMGEDNNYPGTSGTGTFRLSYSGSGPAWVLGEIPFRSSADNSTYSCIWGFSEKPDYGAGGTGSPIQDPGIYESTRNKPVIAVDGGRAQVNYTKDIVQRYNALSTSRINEGLTHAQLWDPYSGLDSRTSVGPSTEDMFSYLGGEFPYCNTPSSPNQILDNIIC
jgi:hypothetical protein